MKNLGYRLNLAGERIGNFTHSNDLERWMAGSAVDWKINSRAFLRLNGDYQRKDLAAQPVIGPRTDGSVPPPIDARLLLGLPWLRYETRAASHGLRFDYSLGESWTVTSQFLRSTNRRAAAFPDVYEVSPTGSIVSGDIYFAPNQKFNVVSGQSFLSGSLNTAGIRHDIVSGFSSRYYTARDGGYAVLPLTVGSIQNPVYSPKPDLPSDTPKNLTENHQSSFFASDLLTFNKSWQAMVGVRAIWYRNDNTPVNKQLARYNQSSVIPTAGITFRPRQGVKTYFSYAEGLEQGGVAPFFASNRGEWLNPVRSRQYEGGVKVDVNRVLTLGVAGYRIEKGLEYVNSSNIYVQNGQQRHIGLEFTASGELTRNLSAVAGFALLNSRLRDTGDPTTTGKQAENTPRRQGSLFLDYLVLHTRSLHLTGGYYYMGDRPINNRNTATVPGYSRLDLGVSYAMRLSGHALTWRGNIQNVTDERYWAAANYGSVYPGRPRIASLTLDFSF